LTLTIGTQLGSLEVTALIGRGGMGEVYRARDTKLKRDVAIKILPDEFSHDADRVSRFQREAEVLASLNHPNIASIYDLEEANGSRYLVLELVEGETLADRIARGPIPVEEALDIAKHICEACEAAHEKGIVHRDLKPANVKIASDGKVKVLDFGLAKAMFSSAPAATLSNSPTLLSGTMGGMIVGTAAYMSPEQARGREADQRSDIFSFGCVLYEMLTGRQGFQGEDVSDVLASVMKIDPDLSVVPPNLNPKLYELLRRCLAKNRKERWYAIGDVRVEIERILAESRGLKVPEVVSVERRPLWKRLAPAIVTAVLIAALTAGVWNIRPKPSGTVSRFSFVLPDGQGLTRAGRPVIDISPDGQNIVYQANRQLYLRPISNVDSRPIDGTNQDAANPFFSSDGRWIGFYANSDNKLKKISITGGAAVTVCECEFPSSASWTADDHVLFALPQKGKGIFRVSANGGKPEAVIAAKPDEFMYGPQLLRDSDHVLYSLSTLDGMERWDKAKIVVESLKSHDRKVLIDGGADARYLPTGQIMYALATTIFVVPFDAAKLAVTGSPVPIIENVARAVVNESGAQIAVANNGSMIYLVSGPGGLQQGTRLAWVDRAGKEKQLALPPGFYREPRVSPDGRQIAVLNADRRDNISLWVYDVSGTSAVRRLTFESVDFPVWTPDSQRIIFRSNTAGGGIFWQRADGNSPAEELEKSQPGGPNTVSPDGKNLVFQTRGPDSHLWIMPLIGDHAPKPLIAAASVQAQAFLSPDGRWIVYTSGESGPQIYVQPFPPVSGVKYQITTTGGFSPVWSPDGKQIFYISPDRQLISVDVRTQPTFVFANPTKLPVAATVRPGENVRPYDIAPDGKQFLIVTSGSEPSEKPAQPQFRITLNWFEELKQRVPVH
jgi:serine/threonine-protein kinase